MALAAAAALTIAVGCGDDSDDDQRSDRSPMTADETSTTGPPTTAVSPEAEVEAAYLGFVEMVERISTTTNDPTDPEIDERTVDPMLGALRDNISTDQSEGRVWQIGDQTRHRIDLVEVADATAVVTDCIVENDVLVDRSTAKVIDQQARSTRLMKTTLVHVDHVWKVKFVDPAEEWSGVDGCAG